LASYVVVLAIRRGWSPNALSVANLVLGSTTSALVAVCRHDSAIAATIGLVGWQLSYALDCADGQLARYMGTGSSSGALVDVLCDYIVQALTVTACFLVIAPAFSATTLALTGPLVATGLLLSLFDTTVATQVAGIQVATGPIRWPTLGKRTVRDYGLIITVVPLLIWWNHTALLALLAAQASLNAVAVIKRLADVLGQSGLRS
jgi:phosphatidylglycerophosphate synthase